ncbi:MAG: hypothetical protein Q8J88_01815 [Bacteroidales bacterium]|nr:hypothetical protein [Bacteroidales bacterium]
MKTSFYDYIRHNFTFQPIVNHFDFMLLPNMIIDRNSLMLIDFVFSTNKVQTTIITKNFIHLLYEK